MITYFETKFKHIKITCIFNFIKNVFTITFYVYHKIINNTVLYYAKENVMFEFLIKTLWNVICNNLSALLASNTALTMQKQYANLSMH